MIPTNLEALERSELLSPEGKLRFASEPDVPPAAGDQDESVASFVSRRFGREAYESLVEPLMTGIYGGDGDRLSLRATFPQLRVLELEHGSILRGLSAPPPSELPPFVSLRDGMGSLASAVVDALERTELLLGRAAARVSRSPDGFGVELVDGEVIDADGVVVATPAFVAAELLADLDPELAAAHAAIPYASSVVVTLAFSRADVTPLDGYGYLVPRVDGADVLACTWTSQKWESRAPDDSVLIRVYAGRFGGRDLTKDTDDALVALARAEVSLVGGVAEPVLDPRAPLATRHAAVPPRSSGASGADRRCVVGASGTRRGRGGVPRRRDPRLHRIGGGCGRVGRASSRRSAGVTRESSERLFAEALDLLPGGVSSPVRAFKAVGGSPLFIERGEGAYLVDVDGNRYVDYVLSWGPLILGHAHPRVVAALEEALRKGTSFGAPSPLELELARLIRDAMPSLELVRFVSSGTEATMSAIRVARAFTQRTKIVKFVGCYHGHADFLLVQAGSGVATLGLPDSPGVTPGAVADTLTAPFNDLADLEALFAAHDDIAAVIVEPVVGNMGLVLPQPGFLAGSSRAHVCTRRAPRLRRGDDRVSRSSGRRAGALRRDARPDDAGEGDRRRASRRRVRRTPRDHGAGRARRPRLPGGDALRKSARDDGRNRDAAGDLRARCLGRSRTSWRAARGRSVLARRRRPGRPRGNDVRHVLLGRARHELGHG